MNKLQVFLGYDFRQDIMYQVAKYSILKHSDRVEVYPLVLDELRAKGIYKRQRDSLASTDFTYSRFLTPYLSTSNISIYSDLDFLYLIDIDSALLRQHVIGNYAVWVVKHDYTSSTLEKKSDHSVQIPYPRKNWASFMVFNNNHPKIKAMTPDWFNSFVEGKGHRMIRMPWLEDEDIGSLPPDKFNFIVGDNPPPEETKGLISPTENTPYVIHYTLGGPLEGDRTTPKHGFAYDDLWLEYHRMYKEEQKCNTK